MQIELLHAKRLIIIIIIIIIMMMIIIIIIQAEIWGRASDVIDKTRLLAAASPHSGDWLHGPPISSIGLRLDNEMI